MLFIAQPKRSPKEWPPQRAHRRTRCKTSGPRRGDIVACRVNTRHHLRITIKENPRPHFNRDHRPELPRTKLVASKHVGVEEPAFETRRCQGDIPDEGSQVASKPRFDGHGEWDLVLSSAHGRREPGRGGFPQESLWNHVRDLVQGWNSGEELNDSMVEQRHA